METQTELLFSSPVFITSFMRLCLALTCSGWAAVKALVTTAHLLILLGGKGAAQAIPTSWKRREVRVPREQGG